MPFVNVRITKEQGCPTTEQRKNLLWELQSFYQKCLIRIKLLRLLLLMK